MNTIELKGFDPHPKALLHTLHNNASRLAEIKDQKKHMDHLLNINKGIPAEVQFRLNQMNENLDMFKQYPAELTMWSVAKINVGDVIEIEFYNKKFAVDHIEYNGDHAGRFVDPNHAVGTYYVLYGTTSFINEPPKPVETPEEKAAKAKK